MITIFILKIKAKFKERRKETGQNNIKICRFVQLKHYMMPMMIYAAVIILPAAVNQMHLKNICNSYAGGANNDLLKTSEIQYIADEVVENTDDLSELYLFPHDITAVMAIKIHDEYHNIANYADETTEMSSEDALDNEARTEENTNNIDGIDNVAENNISDNNHSVDGNRWNISLTDDEIDLLARIVWVESRGEPVLGQEAVVEVTLNRIMSDEFPNDLYSVLSAKKQYASWELRNTAYDYEEQVETVKRVLNGETQILPVDTYYFATSPLTDELVTIIEHHYFCR